MLLLQSPQQVSRALGARVRGVRLARNLSQQELAARSGVSLSSIRRLEASGQGTLLLLVQVAQVLHVADGLEGLFVLEAQSIAQADSVTEAQRRQRARKPRKQRDGSARSPDA